MKSTKLIFITVVVTGLLGAVLSSWISPSAIAWYFDPPTNIGVNCRGAVEWALEKFQVAQLMGLGIGAVLGLGIGFMFVSKRNTNAKSPTV